MHFILHHYPMSPYSEKIRAMFGYTEMEWDSCLTSEAPPRGKLDLLTGGYGRIPVAQAGSDIYCDTNIIADEIAQASKQTALANALLNEDDLAQRQWFESKLFFACVNRAFSPTLLKRIAKEKGVWNLAKFLKDRIQMGFKASIPMGSPKSAPKYISRAIEDIAGVVAEQSYLAGESPGVLDFAAYHCFWFLIEVGQKNDLDAHRHVLAWYQRMAAFSSDPVNELTIESALAEARKTEPKPLEQRFLQDHRIGSEIVIAPNDYRQVPVSGILAGVDETRWIVQRDHPETGRLHLHFPSHGVDVTLRLQKDSAVTPA